MTATESHNTHKDIIADGIAALSAQLAAGNSAALTTYLGTIGRFHNYSFGNVMAIAMQRPDAVRVAGFHTWKSLGQAATALALFPQPFFSGVNSMPHEYQFATILNPGRNRSRRPRRSIPWLALAVILLGILAVLF